MVDDAMFQWVMWRDEIARRIKKQDDILREGIFADENLEPMTSAEARRAAHAIIWEGIVTMPVDYRYQGEQS